MNFSRSDLESNHRKFKHRPVLHMARIGLALLAPALLAVTGCARVKPSTPTSLRAEFQKPLDNATSASLAKELTLGQAGSN